MIVQLVATCWSSACSCVRSPEPCECAARDNTERQRNDQSTNGPDFHRLAVASLSPHVDPGSVAVVVILGHPPEVDLVDNVADDGESVLGDWSRADELVLFEGPTSWEVVVHHLAHLRA